MRGEIEVSVKTGCLDFVLDRLFRGSIINYRTFFLTDKARVQYTFTRASIVQELKYSDFQSICTKYDTLDWAF